MMDDFEFVLSRLHRAGKRRFDVQWIEKLERRRVKLEGAYATLYETDRDPIPYSSLSAQTAYVFAYAPARAEYTRQFLNRHRLAYGKPLFDREHVEVVSFGGGPASELVGLVRYLENEKWDEPVKRIDYVVYDKDAAWAELAERIVTSLDTDLRIEIKYEQADFADRRKMDQIDLSAADLVVFSYVMSELAQLGAKNEIAENFRRILAAMKLNSKILFIDSKHPIFIDYFKLCKIVNGLVQKNDDDRPVDCGFPPMSGTFKILADVLDWSPRTELNALSKLVVRIRM